MSGSSAMTSKINYLIIYSIEENLIVIKVYFYLFFSQQWDGHMMIAARQHPQFLWKVLHSVESQDAASPLRTRVTRATMPS
jgi:hypothetical protein